MKDYIISCCSTSDLSKEYYQKNNIPFICFHYCIDNIQYTDDFGQMMSIDEFYKKIDEGALPTTSQVNVNEYINFFEKFLKEDKDIIHVCLSSGISGTYNSCCLAKEELVKRYPNNKIIIIDSLGASSGYGLLISKMKELKDCGFTIDQLNDWVEENKLKVNHWFFSTNLFHYKRGGRISSVSAILGTVLSVFPILFVDKNGKLVVDKKVHGKKRLLMEMVNRMIDGSENGIDYSDLCYISHSNCLEDAKILKDLIEGKFVNLINKVEIFNVGTVIGSHTGTGTIALFFFGKNRVK